MSKRMLLTGLWTLCCILGLHAGDTLRIACVGNSITEGFGLDHKSVEAYPARMQQIMGDEYCVMNFGLSGHCVMNDSDRPYMRPTKVKHNRFREALESQPDIVTIKLGTNDSKTYNWEAHRENFVPSLCAMIDSFAALPTRPQIYLCLPIPCDGEQWTIRDSIIAGEIIPLIRQVAETRGLPVIDLYTPLKPFPELLKDKIHPVRGGAMIIAEEIARRIMLDVATGRVHCAKLDAAAEQRDKAGQHKGKGRRRR